MAEWPPNGIRKENHLVRHKQPPNWLLLLQETTENRSRIILAAKTSNMLNGELKINVFRTSLNAGRFTDLSKVNSLELLVIVYVIGNEMGFCMFNTCWISFRTQVFRAIVCNGGHLTTFNWIS